MAGKPQPLKDADYRIGGTPLIRKIGRGPLQTNFNRLQVNRTIPVKSPLANNSISQNLNPPTQQITSGAGAPASSGPIAIPVPAGVLQGQQQGPSVTNPNLPQNLRKVADSHSSSGIIAAGNGVTFLNVPGISFYFETLLGAGSNGILARIYKQGQPSSQLLFFQATGIRYGNTVFDAVELSNLPGNGQVSFQIVIGGGIPSFSYDEFLDRRANPSSSSVPVMTDKITEVSFTTRVPGWANTLAGGTSQAITESATLGTQRAYLLISNLDAANLLQLLDASGNIIASIQPSVTYQFPVNGTITLKNPNVGAVLCNIGEGYYQ